MKIDGFQDLRGEFKGCRAPVLADPRTPDIALSHLRGDPLTGERVS